MLCSSSDSLCERLVGSLNDLIFLVNWPYSITVRFMIVGSLLISLIGSTSISYVTMMKASLKTNIELKNMTPSNKPIILNITSLRYGRIRSAREMKGMKAPAATIRQMTINSSITWSFFLFLNVHCHLHFLFNEKTYLQI